MFPQVKDASQHKIGQEGVYYWRFNGTQFAVIITKDDGVNWHMSISHPNRYPTYEELKEARYKFCPDEVEMAQIFPPKSEFVNVHPNCFHLWQIPKINTESEETSQEENSKKGN